VKGERLFELLNYLLDKRRVTAPELAARFGVSERTIYRDMESLSGCGVPVIANQGAGGGFEIMEGFKLEKSYLSPPELADLSGALRGFDEALKAPALRTSLGKLSALGAAGRRAKDAPFPLPPPLSISLTPWGGPSPDAALVDLFRRAIDARRPLSIDYSDARGDASERIIEPYTILLGGATWYAHAWCRERGAFRLFRLSRVRKAAFASGTFDPYAHGPVPPPFAESAAETIVEVVLEADARSRVAFEEAFGAEAIVDDREGRVRARFRYPEGEWLVRSILALAIEVEVISPESLRGELYEAARGIVEKNRKIDIN
jgi:predicted DNA-binding transcriptional regulator YafY